MKARISTIIKADLIRMWAELQKIDSLMQVASPILHFKPQDGQSLPARWEVGNTYTLHLLAFYILPLGKHYIDVKQIDHANYEIFTSEHGTLTKTWDHRIRLEPLNGSAIRYMDEVVIDAGILTPFIWAFAHIFYRHRQRRWKELMAK